MSERVRIGYGLGTAGTGDLGRLGALVDAVEGLRFDSLWFSERVAGPAPDPLVAMAVAAGRSSRLKLGTSVLVVPGRNPFLLAKQLASLDALSAGRLLPAVGLGAVSPVEQEAFGVERGDRASMFDEALPLLRRLWTEDEVDHQGRWYRCHGMSIGPKPVQQPLELWMGGRAPAELRRVGRLGDGWLASFSTPADVGEGRPIIETAAAEAGRAIDPGHFGVLVVYCQGPVPERLVALARHRRPDVDPADLFPTSPDAVAALLTRFIDTGFSKFVLVPAHDPPDWDAELRDLATTVLPLQQ